MTAVEIPAPFTVTKINAPVPERGKVSERLGEAGILGIGVQVVAPKDGETNLHMHPGIDSAWVVLSGEAEFYGTASDVFVARLGVHECITIPRATPYWFKAAGDEPLVILHVTARTPSYNPEVSRIDLKPQHEWFGERAAVVKEKALDN